MKNMVAFNESLFYYDDQNSVDVKNPQKTTLRRFMKNPPPVFFSLRHNSDTSTTSSIFSVFSYVPLFLFFVTTTLIVISGVEATITAEENCQDPARPLGHCLRDIPFDFLQHVTHPLPSDYDYYSNTAGDCVHCPQYPPRVAHALATTGNAASAENSTSPLLSGDVAPTPFILPGYVNRVFTKNAALMAAQKNATANNTTRGHNYNIFHSSGGGGGADAPKNLYGLRFQVFSYPPSGTHRDEYLFRLAVKESDMGSNGGSVARVSIILGPADNFLDAIRFQNTRDDKGVEVWAPSVNLLQRRTLLGTTRNRATYPLCSRDGNTMMATDSAGLAVTDRCVPKQCNSTSASSGGGALSALAEPYLPMPIVTTPFAAPHANADDTLGIAFPILDANTSALLMANIGASVPVTPALAHYAAGAGTHAHPFSIAFPSTFMGYTEAQRAKALQTSSGGSLASASFTDLAVRDVNYPLYAQAPTSQTAYIGSGPIPPFVPSQERCNDEMAYSTSSSESGGRRQHPLETLHAPPATPPRLSGIILADRPFVVGPTYTYAALLDNSFAQAQAFFTAHFLDKCGAQISSYMTNAAEFSAYGGWRGRRVYRNRSGSSSPPPDSLPAWRGPASDTFFGGLCRQIEVIGNPHGPTPARPYPPSRVGAVLVTGTLNVSQRIKEQHNLLPYIPAGPTVSFGTADGWWEAPLTSSTNNEETVSRNGIHDPSPLPPAAMPTVGESTALMAHCTIDTDPTAFLVTLIPPNATGPVNPYFDRSLLANLPAGADPDTLMLLEEYFCVGLDKGAEHMQIACQGAESCIGFTTLVNVNGKEYAMCLLRQPKAGTTAASRLGHTRYAFPRMFYYKQPPSARRCSVRVETSGMMAVYLQQTMFGEQYANVLVTIDGREVGAYCGNDVGMYGAVAATSNLASRYALCTSNNQSDGRSFRVQSGSIVTVEAVGAPMRIAFEATSDTFYYFGALLEVVTMDPVDQPPAPPLPTPPVLDRHDTTLPVRASVLIEETSALMSVFVHRAKHAALLATQSVFDCKANVVVSRDGGNTNQSCVSEQLRIFTTTLSQAPAQSMSLLDNIPKQLVAHNIANLSATSSFAATSCQACGGAAGFLEGFEGRSDQCSVEQWCGGPIPLAPTGNVPFSDRCSFSSSSAVTTPRDQFSTKPGAAVSSITTDLVPSDSFSGFVFLQSGASLNARTKLCSGIRGTLAIGPSSSAVFPLKTTTVFILIPATKANVLNESTAIAAAVPFLKLASGIAGNPAAASYLDPILSLRVGAPNNLKIPLLVNLTAAGYAPSIAASVFGSTSSTSLSISLSTANARELASAFRLVNASSATATTSSGGDGVPMLQQACLVDNIMSTQQGSASSPKVTCTFVLPINTTYFSLDLAQIGFVNAKNDVSITLIAKSNDTEQFGEGSFLNNFDCGPTRGFGKNDAAFGLCDVYYTCQSRFLFPTPDFARRFYDEANGSVLMQVVIPDAKPSGCAMNVAAIATFSQPDERPGAPGSNKTCNAATEFLCAADRKCFPQSAICDGTYDCSDRSDEFLCRVWYPLDLNETHATNQYRLFRSDGGHSTSSAVDPFTAAGDLIQGNTSLQACKREAMRQTLLNLGKPSTAASQGGVPTFLKLVDSLLYNTATKTCWLPNTDNLTAFHSILEHSRTASTVITRDRIRLSTIPSNNTQLRTYVAVIGSQDASGFSLCENSMSCSGNGVLIGAQTAGNKTDQTFTQGGKGACTCRCDANYTGTDCSVRKTLTLLGEIVAVFENGASFVDSISPNRLAAAMNAGDATIQCNFEVLFVTKADIGLRCAVDALSGGIARSEVLRRNLLDAATLAVINSCLVSSNHPLVAYFTPFGAMNAFQSIDCVSANPWPQLSYTCGTLPAGDYQSIRVVSSGRQFTAATVEISQNTAVTSAVRSMEAAAAPQSVSCNMVLLPEYNYCTASVCDVAFGTATTNTTTTYANPTVQVSSSTMYIGTTLAYTPASNVPCPNNYFRIEARPRIGDANTTARSVLANRDLDFRGFLVAGILVLVVIAVVMVIVGTVCLVRGHRRLQIEKAEAALMSTSETAPAATAATGDTGGGGAFIAPIIKNDDSEKEKPSTDDGSIIAAKLSLLVHLRFFRNQDLSKPVRTGAKCLMSSIIFFVLAIFLILVYATSAGRRSNFMVLYEEYSDKQCKASTIAYLPRRVFAIPSSNIECELMSVVGEAAGMVFASGHCLEGGKRVLLQIGGSEATCRGMKAMEVPADTCVPVGQIIAGTSRSTFVQFTCTDSDIALRRVNGIGNLTTESAETRVMSAVQGMGSLPIISATGADMPFVSEGAIRSGIRPTVPYTALSEPDATTFDLNTNAHRLVLQTLETVKAPKPTTAAQLATTYIAPTVVESQYRSQMTNLPLGSMQSLLPTAYAESYPVGYLFNNFGHASQKEMKGTTGIRYYGVRRTPFDMGAYLNDDTSLADGIGFTISMNIRASATTSGFAFVVTDAFENTASNTFYPIKRLEEILSSGRGSASWYDSTYHIYSSLFLDGPGNSVIFAFADPKDDPAAADKRPKTYRRGTGDPAPVTTNVQIIQWDLAKIDQTRLFNGHWHHLAIVFRVENDKPKALIMIDGKTSYSAVGWQQCVERFPTSVARHEVGQALFVHDLDTDRVVSGGALVTGLFSGGLHNLYFEPRERYNTYFLVEGTQAMRDFDEFPVETVRILAIVLFLCAIAAFLVLVGSVPHLIQSSNIAAAAGEYNAAKRYYALVAAEHAQVMPSFASPALLKAAIDRTIIVDNTNEASVKRRGSEAESEPVADVSAAGPAVTVAQPTAAMVDSGCGKAVDVFLPIRCSTVLRWSGLKLSELADTCDELSRQFADPLTPLRTMLYHNAKERIVEHFKQVRAAIDAQEEKGSVAEQPEKGTDGSKPKKMRFQCVPSVLLSDDHHQGDDADESKKKEKKNLKDIPPPTVEEWNTLVVLDAETNAFQPLGFFARLRNALRRCNARFSRNKSADGSDGSVEHYDRSDRGAELSAFTLGADLLLRCLPDTTSTDEPVAGDHEEEHGQRNENGNTRQQREDAEGVQRLTSNRLALMHYMDPFFIARPLVTSEQCIEVVTTLLDSKDAIRMMSAGLINHGGAAGGVGAGIGHAQSGIKGDSTAKTNMGADTNASAGGGALESVKGRIAELLAPVIIVVQSVYVWMSSLGFPQSYGHTFNNLFSFLSIDFAEAFDGIPPIATPLIQLFGGLIAVSLLFYLMLSDNWLFFTHAIRYIMRRDAVEESDSTMPKKTEKKHNDGKADDAEEGSGGEKEERILQEDDIERDPRVPVLLHEAMRSECPEAPIATVEQLPITSCRQIDLFLGIYAPVNDDESPAAQHVLIQDNGSTSKSSQAVRSPLVTPATPPIPNEVEGAQETEEGNHNRSMPQTSKINFTTSTIGAATGNDEKEEKAVRWNELNEMAIRSREGDRLIIERRTVSSCFGLSKERYLIAEKEGGEATPQQQQQQNEKKRKNANKANDDNSNNISNMPPPEVKIESLKLVCPRHPTVTLVPQVQSKLWPFDNRPECCVVDPNGKLCKTDCGSLFVCNEKYKDETTGEEVLCTFALCERHSRPTLSDAIKTAAFYKFAQQIKMNGKEWFLCFIALIVANAVYMPFLKTAMMILSCHPSYQCEFQRCWEDPDQKFIIAAFLSGVLLLVLGVGYPMMLVGLLDTRRKMLRTFFVHEGYQKRYAELTDKDIEERAEEEERKKERALSPNALTSKAATDASAAHSPASPTAPSDYNNQHNGKSSHDEQKKQHKEVEMVEDSFLTTGVDGAGNDRMVVDSNGNPIEKKEDEKKKNVVFAVAGLLRPQTVSVAEWSRFASTDTSALASLYNTVHYKWLFLPPILLLLKVMLLGPAVFIESRSVNQRIGTAVVEIVYAMFMFFTETQVSPIVVFSFRFASMHQLLILGLSNIGLVRQHEENKDYATAMIISTGGFLLINVVIVFFTVVYPSIEPIFRLRSVVAKLASLGFSHSGSVTIYLDPWKFKEEENVNNNAGTAASDGDAPPTEDDNGNQRPTTEEARVDNKKDKNNGEKNRESSKPNSFAAPAAWQPAEELINTNTTNNTNKNENEHDNAPPRAGGGGDAAVASGDTNLHVPQADEDGSGSGSGPEQGQQLLPRPPSLVCESIHEGEDN